MSDLGEMYFHIFLLKLGEESDGRTCVIYDHDCLAFIYFHIVFLKLGEESDDRNCVVYDHGCSAFSTFVLEKRREHLSPDRANDDNNRKHRHRGSEFS